MKTLSANPKVSIIMSVYNAEDTLGEAIDSILNQTYSNWEFVICNDCSTDSTMSILEDYKKRFPEKFIILNNLQNMRLSYSLNRCLKEVTGELIARMDGDDLSVPERFEKQVRFLKTHPEYQLVGTDMQRFNEKGKLGVIGSQTEPDKFILKTGVAFCHATIMAYREVFEVTGGYRVSKDTMRSQDYDLWFRFFKCGFKGYNIHEPLYLVRETLAAVKRRDFSNRYHIMRIQFRGYKLLGFPKMWYFIPVLQFLKGFIPAKLLLWYHERGQ